jgi:hypothetical protein
MKRHERAAQLWSLLVFAARMQQVLSYSTIEKMTGLPKQGMGKFLSLIQRYCEHHKLPLLNALAVNQQEGLPGEGYHGDFSEIVKIFQEQSKVFVYDWLKDNAPAPEELEKFDQ